ncbi:MAG: heavy-metal-associated domain-containing protein [Polymorphobacter sp.]|uniref:heavy-metal-associated domain-containing protein n=1 Tax=Polymorphobacter sp. TaxID=1909290 RepID=UPI003A87A0AB
MSAFQLLFLVAAGLLAAGPVRAQPQDAPEPTVPEAGAEAGSAYAVGGIKVDVSAKTPQAARFAAYRIAQRKAWPLLFARLTGKPASSAPPLSDAQLDKVVAGIESQGERFSMTRYMATLGVVFDRLRIADYVGGLAGSLQSAPMLLLPVWTDAGATTIHHQKTPWADAWARFRLNVTPIDYVLAPGKPVDNILLTGWQVRRPVRSTWRTIMARYGARDVLMAEARLVRSWPGGPLRVDFVARHGPDGTALGRFALTTTREDELATMLDQAVMRIDSLYVAALQQGRLSAEPSLALDLAPIEEPALFSEAPATAGQTVDDAVVVGTEVLVATPSAAAFDALSVRLRSLPGVTAVTATSLSLGGSSRLLLSHFGNRQNLAEGLVAKGFSVTDNGELLVLRSAATVDETQG